MYTIVDIETTGGSPRFEKITEIAIYIHDGNTIIDEFCTLINPEKHIPPYITSLTGITNEMVENAPKFFEIARKIVEMTNDCIFVAHNASFDYNFVKSEFRQLGYEYERKTLCTVKLSRKLIPGLKSYSLGNICSNLNIHVNGRHRAAGDALATVKLFEILKEENERSGSEICFSSNKEGRFKNLNGFITPADIDKIPEKTGVYYFHDSEGNLIYIGKSKNIYHRVLSHFANHTSRKAEEMKIRTAAITWELTGSELVSLLKESDEIKNNKPLYNRQQRRSIMAWGLFSFKDRSGYLNFRIKKVSDENILPVTGFTSKKEALEDLLSLVERYWLCQKLCGIYETDGACFHYSIRQCNGACIAKEPVKIYNERAEKILNSFNFDINNFLVIDKGRTNDERSVICVENGVYKGYGYISINDSYLQISDMISCIRIMADNRDARMIIKGWLKKNKAEKILQF